MGNVVSIVVCHETRTDVGFINVTVMFSGATRMEPSKIKRKNIVITNSIIQKKKLLFGLIISGKNMKGRYNNTIIIQLIQKLKKNRKRKMINVLSILLYYELR